MTSLTEVFLPSVASSMKPFADAVHIPGPYPQGTDLSGNKASHIPGW